MISRLAALQFCHSFCYWHLFCSKYNLFMVDSHMTVSFKGTIPVAIEQQQQQSLLFSCLVLQYTINNYSRIIGNINK